MAKSSSKLTPAKVARPARRTPPASRTPPVPRVIRFSATLHRPAVVGGEGHAPADRVMTGWTFLKLPKEASAKLPSRGMVSVAGAINGFPIMATLEPDGQGGHWLRVDRKVATGAGARVGDVVMLEITPVEADDEPEPVLPPDVRKALAGAPVRAREVWSDITPVARRDWIFWMTSGKRVETRVKRITTACDMLAKGKRRPCCFDRSGMYGKSLSCPVADDTGGGTAGEVGRP